MAFVEINNLSKSFDNNLIFKDLNIIIVKGQKVAFAMKINAILIKHLDLVNFF